MNAFHGAGRPAGRRLILAAPVLALALAGAACGGDDTGAAAAKAPAAAEAPPGTHVAIDTFMFAPRKVSVHVGDTVTWTNGDAILHTVTSGTREYDPANSGLVTATHKDGAFDMQLDGKGATAHFTFTRAGTFHYFCDRHPGMEADVEVS
ncbi:MAG TPA: plastocyanin/azurin family copper-binding protein [Solirubrobacterales bacterium]|nr:plastocyanin/azurin family copper-binding protein [Solirubrobacterales bacterium]